MRKALALLILLCAGQASAAGEWRHNGQLWNERWVVTVKVKGGEKSWTINKGSSAGLDQLDQDSMQLTKGLEQSLNETMARVASENGVNFMNGKLTGNISATLVPDAAGVVNATIGGLSYSVQNSYAGKKWGVLHYSCVNTTSLENMLIVAQYGAGNGQLTDKVGLNGTPQSSTDCDSNLSWILPFIGDKIISRFERIADTKILEGVNGMTGKLKDSLFFGRDQNWKSGLENLIPADRGVALPDGSTFPIGQYVQTNLARIIAESRMGVRNGSGIKIVRPTVDFNGGRQQFTGEVLALDVGSGSVDFSVTLSQQAEVNWFWYCPPNERVCPRYD
ncbi:hypothetical protein MJ904_12765 [Massilia sp. MB5]|uniref:hypothetical protein n=1 Tax=Massilia sp. MB5 TaxID=2919578 RepID=UPI001F105466|nr:hypothetical protein [Massilia sp. MB5]UMR32951.1 hypothetical protein MJ904_12765 [Massilia sp. MB5]